VPLGGGDLRRCRSGAIPQPRRHGETRVRARRVPLLRLSTAADGGVAARGHLPAPLANEWQEKVGATARFPATHAQFIARCHAAGQARPTPLLLRYGAGDYNCLHRDLHGEHVFPLQVAILLSAPREDFTGGEFVLTEQRPRMQSRAEVVRPVRGTRGVYRVTHRHGVSRVRSGSRHTLGVIFHDAE
jgi:hypothetical protein